VWQIFNYHPLRCVNSCLITGIGNPTHLAANGIQSLVDLPGVGENLLVSDLSTTQGVNVLLNTRIKDHIFAFIQYEVKSGIRTFGEIWRGAPAGSLHHIVNIHSLLHQII
jgi:hypothetical protein